MLRLSAPLLLFFTSLLLRWIVDAQTSIPPRLDGFVYGDRPATTDSVMIEAFFDPVCPDSRDSWPPLKLALQHHGSRVSLIVHPFPLPYHDNAFVTSRALHIVNKLNSSATYHLLELFFKHQMVAKLGDTTKQRKFYNQQTFNMSRASVVNHVAKFVSKAVGNSYFSAVESGFTDRKTDLATRVSFKYGCSRGVFGTPFFFVNGFLLPDGGSALNYSQWRGILDPLVGTEAVKGAEPVRYLL